MDAISGVVVVHYTPSAEERARSSHSKLPSKREQAASGAIGTSTRFRFGRSSRRLAVAAIANQTCVKRLEAT